MLYSHSRKEFPEAPQLWLPLEYLEVANSKVEAAEVEGFSFWLVQCDSADPDQTLTQEGHSDVVWALFRFL